MGANCRCTSEKGHCLLSSIWVYPDEIEACADWLKQHGKKARVIAPNGRVVMWVGDV